MTAVKISLQIALKRLVDQLEKRILQIETLQSKIALKYL